MPRRPALLLLLLTACSPGRSGPDDAAIVPTGPTEEYGFVATLGRDTVAAERVTLGADALVSESVDRWPVVRQRRTELAIGPDGGLTRMRMAISTPSGATPAERWRMVRARFTTDSVHVTIEDSSGTTGRSFATDGAITVPHVSMQYAVIEFEIAATIRRAKAVGRGVGDTLIFRQFYPDRDVGPRFVLHRGRVIPLGEDRVELRHDWLSGAGDAVVDDAGRLLGYSGQRSTYKVAVARTAEPPAVAAIAAALVAAERRTGRAQLSVRDTARGTVGAATITVDHGRPLARGRVLLGNVIAFDRVWRTGANEATQLRTSRALTLAGLAVPAGTYTLWTIPHPDGTVDLIVNRQTGQWGTTFDPGQNLGVAPLAVETLPDTVEQFTIRVTAADQRRGNLIFEWGTFRWIAPISLAP